ncbi:hypothetical protein [Spirosoma flavus]
MKWFIGLFFFHALAVWGQSDQNVQTYLDQGHRYEEQSHYRKALEVYRKALNYATPTTRSSVQQAINRVDELIQQQTLVIESQTQEIRKVTAKISSTTNRNRIQSELIALQQNEDATVSNYKVLLRRANALKQVEDNIADSDEEVSRPAPLRPTTPIRRPTKPKPTLGAPPPKTITSSMPSTPKEATRSKMETKALKSIKGDQH